MSLFRTIFVAGLILAGLSGFAQDEGAVPVKKKKFRSELSGAIEVGYRIFPDSALYAGQKDEYFSALFRPKYYLEWGEGKHSINFEGFAVLDQYDNKRSHADIRELYYRYVYKSFEASLGAKKIYWGVAESNHLVDVINQADVLEGFDPKNKLGQPMLHLSVAPKWGTLDLMVMPYFRTLEFPGTPSRSRPEFGIELGEVEYEAELEEFNPDVAIRWSHSFSVFDVGIANFYGTNRLPLVKFEFVGFMPSAHLYYETINQTSIDLQAATGPMLWKTEAIYRVSKDTARDPITAVVLGGEYSFGNIFRSGIDVGLLVEYSYDSRPVNESFNALTNDMFFATRIAVNDVQSTEFLVGIMVGMLNQETKGTDPFSGSRVFNYSASRRLGTSWKISVTGTIFDNVDKTEFLYFLRNDSFIRLGLAKYF